MHPELLQQRRSWIGEFKQAQVRCDTKNPLEHGDTEVEKHQSHAASDDAPENSRNVFLYGISFDQTGKDDE
jgi:hypothetical protein